MEEGKRSTGDTDKEIEACTPADCRTDSDGDTSSDEERLECTVTTTSKPLGASEEAGMEAAENRDVDEESYRFKNGTDEEEGNGMEGLSPSGAGAVAVKSQTIYQQPYQLLEQVTQYNLIQVQQKFGDVAVKGAENLNVGGTQNVGTTPTSQEEEEIPLTLAQKIRKRTASRIQEWTKDMVETDALNKVKEKLDRGATWVTIKGRPGEGKSTTAYMALKDQHSQGRQVYQVVSPKEFDEVIMACSNPVIMLDDIFGDLEFDAAQWSEWRPSLRPILDCKHPKRYAEKDAWDFSTKSEMKVGQTQVKRTSPNKDKTIIILVGRDYVLKSSLADLGRMADYIASPQYLVEVSSERGSYERWQIWRVHAKAANIHFEDSTVSTICETNCPHGFPHVCKMFFTAYEKDRTLQKQSFFAAPLDFLRKTLEAFLNDKIKRSLFMAMIKRDGKISGQEIEEDDSLGYDGRTAADDMVGSYLCKEDDTFVFDHPSIYDSVSFILSTKLSKFVIENCSLYFIHQRLHLAPPREREKHADCETGFVANISWTYAGHLAGRFASEIKRGNLSYVLSHQAFCISDFVNLLMDCLKTRHGISVSDIVKLTESKKSFCELLPSCKSDHLIKYIMEKENISFTPSERRDLLLGVCQNAASSLLKYISGHMKLEVNARYGRRKKTPLMLAAKTRDSAFVSQIMSLNPDLNARERFGESTFYYLCKNGLTSAVDRAIDMGVDVNQDHGSDGHPLYHAIEGGHLEVVKLLVYRNCDIDNQRGLACAVRSLNTNMVCYFLDRGAVVDGSVVCRACEVGNRNIVEMLLEKGGTVDTMLPNGDTPLLSSCKGNPTVVSCLLEKGASVNQASNVTGDTPLHRAARWGSTKCVDVLLKADADINVQNNTGDSPLHRAAQQGFTEVVDMLLKAGAVMHVQNDTGDTPLHVAVAEWTSAECVDMLLRAGADVNVQNNTGGTSLHSAAATVWESSEHVGMLLKAGADVNVQNHTRDTPLHLVAAEWLSKERVGVLLKAGADVNAQSNTGDTPLHNAAAVRKDRCVDALVKAGAHVNVQNSPGDTPLHRAARVGSTENLDVLLKAGAEVNIQSNTGDTPLHTAAAWWGSKRCVDMLLTAGADVNVQNNTGDTPLHVAARRGFTHCIDVLVKAEADVNIQNNTGDRPLHKAARRGSTQCIDLLLKAGAEINVQNNTGDTPLRAAAEWRSTKCVDVLLKAGADVNVQNITGDTSLHAAAMWGSIECVHMLLKAGADVHVQNNTADTALHNAAAERGFTECIDVLVKAGADVNVQNSTGDTPLHRAAAGWGSTDCVDVLVKAGADVNVQNSTGDTPLHRAAAERGSTKCVDVLVKAGADVNVQNSTGDTPLHRAAAERASTKCVDVLVKAGADVNVQSSTGDTPLHRAAAERASTKCVDVLVKAGADVNVQSSTGDTPLHAAARWESVKCIDTSIHAAVLWEPTECIDVLLKAGADIAVQNNTGDTPLHSAARWVSTKCLGVLLKAGADANVQNNTGDTPLHVAAGQGSTECVQLLQRAGTDVNVHNGESATPRD